VNDEQTAYFFMVSGAVILAGLFAIFKRSRKDELPIKKFCPQCGATDYPRQFHGGSGAVECLLWLFFLVPGVIYSFWRLSQRAQICGHCGATGIIPLDSPRAVAEIARLESRAAAADR